MVKFETDRLGHWKSPKSGRIGAQGLNWKFYVNSEIRFAVFDRNNPKEKYLETQGILII